MKKLVYLIIINLLLFSSLSAQKKHTSSIFKSKSSKSTLSTNTLSATYSVIEPTCNTLANGSIVGYAIQGTGPFVFTLSGTSTATNSDGIFRSLLAGTYNLTITDSLLASTSITGIVLTQAALTTSPDTVIAPGTTTSISAFGGTGNYVWTSNPLDATLTTLTNFFASVSVSPPVTTTYTATYLPNLLYNADFSLGANGFTSQANLTSPTNPSNASNAYGVVANAFNWNSVYSNKCKAYGGSGNMLIYNGQNTAVTSTKVWCQKVPVNTNTNYKFTYLIQRLAASFNPTTVEVTINGIAVSSYILSGQSCKWTDNLNSPIAYWNSGLSTTAEICIVDKLLVATNNNDFALDNIKFTTETSCTLTKSVTVSVVPGVPNTSDLQVAISGAGRVCKSGDTKTLTAIYTDLKNSGTYLQPTLKPYTFRPYTAQPGGTILPNESVPIFPALTGNKDDFWSQIIVLPFKFCFFGNSYANMIIGTNGLVSFDTTKASLAPSNWDLDPSPSNPNAAFFDKNAIYGVYQDLHYENRGTVGDINYYVEGVSPNRVYVINFYELPQFSNQTGNRQTSQIVLHETSNIIDVNVKRRIPNDNWNDGNGIIGIQNATGSKGYSPIGRNILPGTPDWSATNESWEFKPTEPDTVVPLESFHWEEASNPGVVFSTANPLTITVDGPQTYIAVVDYKTPCNETLIKRVTNSIFVDVELPLPVSNPANKCVPFPLPTTINIDQTATMLTTAQLPSYVLSYFENINDANDGGGTSYISNPIVYPLTTIPKTLYVRIESLLNGCFNVRPFEILATPSGTFRYSLINTAASFCKNLTSVDPILTNLTINGTYTATPVGLSINASTGVINPSLSDVNTYSIKYTVAATATCPVYVAGPIDVQIQACLTTNTGPICLGSPVNLNVSLPDAQATYTWTNAATSYNSGPLTGSALATVTPTISGSFVYNLSVVAPSGNFTDVTTVVVKPIPTAVVPSSLSYCVGDTVPVSGFTSAVAGTTYTWTSDTTAIGVSASGTGDVPSFTANNATPAPLVATISVTPTANGCTGAVVIYTLTVNPKVTVGVPISFDAYNSATVAASNFTSTTTGATFNWTNSNTAIGLGASGTSNVSSFTATNAGTTDISGTITVTPKFGTCVGTPATYTITVKPTPDVAVPSNNTYCITDTVPISNFTSATAGTTYTWTNNNTAIGLVALGNGNVPSFVATNTTSAPIVATISVIPTASGSSGAAVTYTITVNPKVTVVVPTVAPVCAGANVATTNFTSTTTGVTYSWTNDTTAIGLLSASGTGDVPPFIATNTTASNLVATITVTPKIGNCFGTPSTYTITVKPTPNVGLPANISYCVGDTVPASIFTSTTASTTYAWTNSNTSIGQLALGAGDVPTFTAANTTTSDIVATITVTPNANGCAGTAVAYTITVKPKPNVVVPPNANYCSGDTVLASNYTGNVSGTTYTFTNDTPALGVAASGAGNTTTFIAVNTTPAPIVATIRVTPTANGCPGAVVSYTITINPKATVVVPASFDTYNTVVVAASNFTSPSAGATYTWTNNNTAIGLAASGTGNVPSFTAINTTTTAISGTITITPSLGTCVGTPSTYTITVKPTPDVTLPGNNTYCITDTVPASNFTSPTPGTTYTWTNNNTAIGLAALGNGNTLPFATTNATAATIVATISVIPTAAGISGAAVTYTITVNPKPTVVVPTDLPVCAGTVVTATNFTSTTTGVIYTWTNNNTAIGLLSASGTGNVPSFTATNTTASNLVATITVTPKIGNCSGTPSTYTVTVKPTPTVVVPVDNSYCDTFTVPASNFISAVTGTTYAWTNTNTAIGLAASGTGNILSFPAVNTTTTAIVATITVTPTANGCSGIAKTYTITVNGKPLKPIQNGEISYCLGVTDASLSVTGTNLLWYTSSTGGTGSATVPTINTISIGEKYFYVSQTINGCESDRLKITITIVAAPSLIITSNLPTAVCEPTKVNITGAVIAATSQPGVFTYWKDSAATMPISPQDATAIGVSGTYYLKLNNATGCYTIKPVTVTINPKPIVNLDQNGYVCTDKDGAVLTGSEFNLQTGLSTTVYSFKWYNDTNGIATLPIAGAIASNYRATTPGNYRVEVTNIATTCPEITRTTVVGSVAPDKIEFTKTSYFEDDKTIIVTATPASNYEYQLDNGIFQESNTFIGVTSGNHKIVVRDKYGCGQKTGSLRLLDYPKYFSPNGDGFNDTWNIADIENQSDAIIFIYDRLGKLLKQITPAIEGWNGKFNGADLPADDYWFTVEYQEDLIKKVFKSHFSLKR